MQAGNIHGSDGVSGSTRSLPPNEGVHAVRLYDTVGKDRVAIDVREWLPGCFH